MVYWKIYKFSQITLINRTLVQTFVSFFYEIIMSNFLMSVKNSQLVLIIWGMIISLSLEHINSLHIILNFSCKFDWKFKWVFPMNVFGYYIFMKHTLDMNCIVLIEGTKIHSKILRFWKSQKISINVDYKVGSYCFFIGMQVLTNTSFP